MPLHERNFPCQKANVSDESTICLIRAGKSIADDWRTAVFAFFCYIWLQPARLER
jgi:hypothetical protein